MVDGDEHADGRRRRSLRTREAVVDAMLALVDSGDVEPTSTEIATRAGVTQRTLYRHFESVDDVLDALIARQTAVLDPFLAPIDASGPAAVRAQRLVASRHEMFRTIASVRRFAVRVRDDRAPIDRALRSFAERQRLQVEALFADELDRCPAGERPVRLEALDAASSWEVWDRLERERGLDDDAVAETMTALLSGVLGVVPAAAEPGAGRS